MTTADFDHTETIDCVIRLPAKFVTGDPGDPLSHQIVALIDAMALFEYWPLDFGLNDGQFVELIFNHNPLIKARPIASRFIQTGGST